MVSAARYLGWFVVALLALCLAAPAAAATTYVFEVPEMTIDLWPQLDGGLRVRYKIVFKNLSHDPLDIVDIGTPNDDFQLDSFSASINGTSLSTFRPSQYVTGVEIPLAPHEIQHQREGTLLVEFVHPDMVYYDSDDKSFTSVEFGNTYFGEEFIRKYTKLTMRWHFPDGVTGNETKWHRDEPIEKATVGNHLVFTYRWDQVPLKRMYKTGIGFPARVMQEGAITEHTLFDSCAELIAASCGLIAACAPAIIFFAIVGLVVGLPYFLRRRRLRRYLPPAIGIEGAGPKRGLAAPEAAVILELPPDKVLMMILFGVIKKGAARVEKHDPLTLEKLEPEPKQLRPYERKFLVAINKNGRLSQAKLKSMFVSLVRAANRRLKGFSRRESRDYYKGIVEQAWQQVEGAATPEVGELFAEKAEWLAMDDDFGDRTSHTFGDRDVIVLPGWWASGWGHYRSAPSPTPSGTFTIPGANWAADFTQSVGHFSSTVVDSVSSFTSAVTHVTNPPPVSSTSGGSSSGGGGCACACACAGCACACAGGGR